MNSTFSPRWWVRIYPWLLVLLLAYLPLFWKLGTMPVQPWDEARTGINGLEVLKTGDWLVIQHHGEPDLWNCKPPLHVWALAASFYLFGAGEVALRLPSALAALATVLLVFRVGWRWLGTWQAGLLAALVLLTARGYVTTHVARSGDFDATLTLWTTLAVVSWLHYLRTGRVATAWLTGIALSLAVLTKGVAGAVVGPGLLLAAVLTGEWRRLRRWQPWAAAAVVVLSAATWYIVRELAAPGYLAAVWRYELGGPAGEQLEGHYTDWFFYIHHLADSKFALWLMPALLGWMLGFMQPRGSNGWYLSRVTAASAGFFLLGISAVQTRLWWYDAPVYPLLAIQAAAGIFWLADLGLKQLGRSPGPLAQTVGVLLLGALPYFVQYEYLLRLSDRHTPRPELQYGYLLHELPSQLPHLQEYYMATDGTFNDSPQFYAAAAERRLGHRITELPPWGAAPGEGSVVVACGAKASRPWQRAYVTDMLARHDSCVTLRLVQRR